MKPIFYLLLCPLLLVGFVSCDDDKNNERTYIPVKTVEATTSIDLKDRTGWKLFVGGSGVNSNYEYNYTVEGQKIRGVAKSVDQSFHFLAPCPPGLNCESIGKLPPSVSLVSPSYYLNKLTKETPSPIFNIADQTTPENLFMADALTDVYRGVDSENISGLNLVHANTLLEFNCIDLPEDTEVTVSSYLVDIRPYKKDGIYKAIAIMLTDSQNGAMINVVVGHSMYRVNLGDYNIQEGQSIRALNRDTHYTFTVRFNKYEQDPDKVLTIENLTSTKWSD